MLGRGCVLLNSLDQWQCCRKQMWLRCRGHQWGGAASLTPLAGGQAGCCFVLANQMHTACTSVQNLQSKQVQLLRRLASLYSSGRELIDHSRSIGYSFSKGDAKIFCCQGDQTVTIRMWQCSSLSGPASSCCSFCWHHRNKCRCPATAAMHVAALHSGSQTGPSRCNTPSPLAGAIGGAVDGAIHIGPQDGSGAVLHCAPGSFHMLPLPLSAANGAANDVATTQRCVGQEGNACSVQPEEPRSFYQF